MLHAKAQNLLIFFLIKTNAELFFRFVFDHKSTDPSADTLARLLRPKQKITKLLLDQSWSITATNLEKATYDLVSIRDVRS